MQHSNAAARDVALDSNWEDIHELSGMYSLYENCSPVSWYLFTPQICRQRLRRQLVGPNRNTWDETGIKDRASITTDVWYPCSVYKRNKFGNTVKCPRPISPGNDWWLALNTAHCIGHEVEVPAKMPQSVRCTDYTTQCSKLLKVETSNKEPLYSR